MLIKATIKKNDILIVKRNFSKKGLKGDIKYKIITRKDKAIKNLNIKLSNFELSSDFPFKLLLNESGIFNFLVRF